MSYTLLIPDYQNLNYEERLAKATHWKENSLDLHRPTLGYVNEHNIFVSILITMHKQEAKKNYIEYDYYKLTK